MAAAPMPASKLDDASAAIARLTATKTKAELLESAMERNVLIAPVATTLPDRVARSRRLDGRLLAPRPRAPPARRA